jgi:hypothetical protein
MKNDGSRALRDVAEQQRRRLMLSESHMSSLANYAEGLRNLGSFVPDFDPLDGGTDAEILFLFEKPGPRTAPPFGSGFISRDNDDPTAAATKAFMEQVGLDRKRTVIWNTIPGWNGEIKITNDEIHKSLSQVVLFIGLLPKLRAVVFVGKKAERAERLLKDQKLDFFRSAHPSGRVKARFPEKWKQIPDEWAKVLNF